ncbi:DUF4192 domain-containing protein [Klenkia taihuensis]|uniref:DUF4192 domain-containing protein n=1 Tax=Klenkia taihuensis TaxID=1225127 RepID=A0A1I1QDT5_9ACTN|nr:DUF4192 domain-containing protein [Klenkia taihuensis]GHE08083.1 hypothetical protein GCM10011381_07290 [Klenkia taihuensis]SFD17988.1 protein of unknown function [Klenkia taihuensis]
MSPDDPVHLGTGAELAAALPHLLGFHPQESLVLVALTGDRAHRVGVTLRVDLPGPAPVEDLAEEAVRRLGHEPPAAVVAVVVTEGPDDVARLDPAELLDVPVGDLDPVGVRLLRTRDAAGDVLDLPRRDVVHAVGRALAERGVPLLEALLVRDGRCFDYGCTAPCCDPGAGHPLPGGTSSLAAAAVLDGRVLAADRAEVVGRLAPVTGPAALAVHRACAVVGAEQAVALRELGWARVVERAWARVLDGVAAHRPGRTAALGDQQVAALGWALTDVEVRDRAAVLAVGPDACAAAALWLDLTRRLPDPLTAAPATLLAAAAWARGDGTTARAALDRALAAQPSCSLALLLADGLDAGLPPSVVREWLTAAATRPVSEELGA